MTSRESDGLALLEAIGAFVHRTERRAIPPNVAQQAKRLLLDGVSWMVMGARRAEAQPLLAHGAGASGSSACTLVGAGRRGTLAEALFVNTALAQVHDCSDGRRLARRDGGSNHPGRCVIPAALTLAQAHRLPGHALLDLVVTGYEVASRVRVRVPDMEYPFAVAAMMAQAAEWPADDTLRALALARWSFPALPEAAPFHTDLDFLSQGLIARAAAEGALLSRTARALPLGHLDAELASPLPAGGPQDRYEILSVYIKPYPCCRALHAAIDLAIALRASTAFTAAEVSDVEVRVGNTKGYLFEPVAPDASHKRCQFSIPFVVACALLDGHVGEQSFVPERIAAADVQALQARIRCVYDESLQFNPSGFASYFRPAALAVTTRDGVRHARDVNSPRGSPLNPLTPEELAHKFVEWTGSSLTADAKAELRAMLDDLESLDDASAVMALL